MYAAFETAGSDLLKLLVRPLYGQRPQIGIRELLQNALDAVRELRQFFENHAVSANSFQYLDQTSDVLISIDPDEKGKIWLTVSDRGIGMTAEIVRDFFLKAGASFRTSATWKREFAPEGVSTVLRSGRFGIGALSSFLLGPRLEVKTRHVSAPPEDGVYFSASFEDDLIELQRFTTPAVGTIVRIEIQKPVFFFLLENVRDWDWHTLSYPVVERRIRGKALPQHLHLPYPEASSMPFDWRSISCAGYQAVYWTFSSYPSLICNGIKVTEGEPGVAWKDRQTPWAHPSVHVFDAQGLLPLNLLRENLASRYYPFSDELLHDVTQNLCAFLLTHGPEIFYPYPVVKLPAPPKLVAQQRISGLAKFWLNRDGFSLVHPWHIKKSGIRRALLLGLDDEYAGFPKDLKWRRFDALFWTFGISPELFEEYHKGLLTSGLVSTRTLIFRKELGRKGGLLEYGTTARRATFLRDLQTPEFLQESNVKNLLFATELIFESEKISVADSPFRQFWEDVMEGQAIIPFAPPARQARFGSAFSRLRPLIEVWQQEYLPGWMGELVNLFDEFKR